MVPLLLPTTSLPTLLSWLGQSTLLLGAGWLFYYLVLRRERCFGYNRRFLLLVPWLALGLPPLLTLGAPWFMRGWAVWSGTVGGGMLLPGGLLPTVRILAGPGPGATAAAANVLAWLPALYGAVALGLLLRLGGQALHLWLGTRHWPRQPGPGYTLVFSGGQRPISSFGGWIFWDETAGLAPAEAAAILAHEVAHVRQGHTRTRLLLEVARALLWASPFVHLYPRALECTHEFLADAAALGATPATPGNPAGPYAALLARLALGQFQPDLPLAHSFTQSLTLTRIRMLTSYAPTPRWKRWLALPLSAALLFTMACEKAAELPPPPPPTLSASATLAPPPPPPPAYNQVQQMPEYEGGPNQLLADIAALIKYPEVAKAEKLEGRVFVGFIVAADGSLQAVQVRKGIETSITYPDSQGQPARANIITPAAQALNEAALNAVRNLPGRWTPGREKGKAVAVQYTIPITFAL